MSLDKINQSQNKNMEKVKRHVRSVYRAPGTSAETENERNERNLQADQTELNVFRVPTSENDHKIYVTAACGRCVVASEVACEEGQGGCGKRLEVGFGWRQ